MAKKQNRYAHLAAKSLGRGASGQTINLSDQQVSADHPITINVVTDSGEIITGTFPRDAEGWKRAIEFACGDSSFRELMLAGGQGFPKWFKQFATAGGFIPSANGTDRPMAADEEGS